MSDRLQEIRARLDWWQLGDDKIMSATRTRSLIDDVASLLADYDECGLVSDRAQVIRAGVERWNDNPPQVGRPFTWSEVFLMIYGAHYLMGAIEAVRDAK
jgi:hypothetical protein